LNKVPFAGNAEEADNLHREALARIVFDMADWLKKKRTSLKRESARLRLAGRIAEAKEKAEAADVFEQCFDYFKQLRKANNEASARQSVSHYRQEETGEGQIFTDPTPEEIAEQCRKFQEGWSDAVRELRSTCKAAEVETRTIKWLGRE
jgi:hypothetical protein